MSKRGQNEGTIRQRKDGSWEARYTLGKDADGRQKQKSIYGNTRKEVAEQLTKILESLGTGNYIEKNKQTLSSWLTVWLTEYVIPHRKESTSSGYIDIISCHLKPHLGHIPLQDLRPEHVQQMINSLKKQTTYRAQVQIKNINKKLEKCESNEKKTYIEKIEELKKQTISSTTINHIVTMLSTCLTQAMKNGLIIKNVAKLVNKPKIEETEIEYLTLSEQIEFLKATKDFKFGFIFEFGLATGLRQSELLGLRWKDINFADGTIKITQTLMRKKDVKKENSDKKKTKIIKGTPKTKKGNRTFPVHPIIMEKLKKHQLNQKKEKLESKHWHESGLVFTSDYGTNIEPRYLLKIFHLILKQANLNQRGIHSLRHTFATRAIESGMDVKTLSEILGHEDIATTLNLYVHSSPDEKKIQMEKMGHLWSI